MHWWGRNKGPWCNHNWDCISLCWNQTSSELIQRLCQTENCISSEIERYKPLPFYIKMGRFHQIESQITQFKTNLMCQISLTWVEETNRKVCLCGSLFVSDILTLEKKSTSRLPVPVPDRFWDIWDSLWVPDLLNLILRRLEWFNLAVVPATYLQGWANCLWYLWI
jgi:hypothetical protein